MTEYTAVGPRPRHAAVPHGHPWVDGLVQPLPPTPVGMTSSVASAAATAATATATAAVPARALTPVSPVAPTAPASVVRGSAPVGAPAVAALTGSGASRRSKLPRLSGRPALYLLASMIVSLLASSASPTPLYAIYQAKWGFTPITTTVVFGVYAVAVLGALLTLGKLSDHLGRRPVLLAALVVQAVSLLVLATADGVPALLLGRVIQGLSTGAAVGAIGAGMIDIDRERGTFANAVTPGFGTGSGALLSALAIRYLPAPTHLIYLFLLGVFAVQALGVVFMRETVTRTPGALATLVPEIKLPRGLRSHFLSAAPVLFAAWALAGLYGALGPSLAHVLTGSANVVLGAFTLVVFAGTAVAATAVLRNAAARTVMLTGILALIVGVGLTLLAISAHSSALFFLGTALSGVGFGGSFPGAIRTVVPRAAAHERSGILSLLYTIAYLGLGVPAVIAGYLAVHDGGLIVAAREYGVAVIVLAGFALVGLLRTRRDV